MNISWEAAMYDILESGVMWSYLHTWSVTTPATQLVLSADMRTENDQLITFFFGGGGGGGVGEIFLFKNVYSMHVLGWLGVGRAEKL